MNTASKFLASSVKWNCVFPLVSEPGHVSGADGGQIQGEKCSSGAPEERKK